MQQALEEAQLCLLDAASTPVSGDFEVQDEDLTLLYPQRTSPDVPVGAICVLEGRIIGQGHNRREADADPTAHAEVLAIRQAAAHLGSWRLNGVTLYVTLEPCPMCSGAIWLSRLDRVVFGAWDEKAGACGSIFDIPRDPRLNHRPQLVGGVLEHECAQILKDFFSTQRNSEL